MSLRKLWEMKPRWSNVAATIGSSIIIFSLGCNSIQLKSLWRDYSSGSEAHMETWGGAMTQIEGKRLLVGVVNDSSYLYLSLVTTDKDVERQIFLRGLTVWFDYQGGEEKTFGISFPVGVHVGRGSLVEREAAAQDRSPEGSRTNRFPLDTNTVEIIGPADGQVHSLTIIELKGISLSARMSDERFTYQLRVPLADYPYSIGTKAGATIGLGLETGSFSERRSSEDSGPGASGMRGRRGSGGRGRGAMGGGSGGGERNPRFGQQSEPLSVWAKVQLADSGSVHN